MKISVIIPFYNEEENIAALSKELAPLAELYSDFEAVFVDDGSSDGTWAAIVSAQKRFPFIHPIRRAKNQGQSAAMLAGLQAARGEIMVTLDGDLQNDPADIPKLIEAIGDCDVVCGYRGKRKDSFSKLLASRVGNTVRKWFTRDGVRDTGCSLKAFRRECVGDLPPVDGVHRFMPAYFMLHDRRVIELRVNHRERIHGVSKYSNLKRLPRTVFDLIGFCWYRSRLLR
jgi:dolichol-phosphate mannosyltransferase